VPPEFELFALLRRHGVPFVIVGGHAVNFHGSLKWLRRMKKAAGRTKDLLDLENLPGEDA